MTIISQNQQPQQDRSLPYIPENMPNPQRDQPQVSSKPQRDQQPMFTHEFGEALNRGISGFKKQRNDPRGISNAKPLPQPQMTKKQIRKAKFKAGWNKFKQGFGKVWNFGKNIVPFLPHGNLIKGGMDMVENAGKGIKNIFGKKK